jgi:hypothetical protein
MPFSNYDSMYIRVCGMYIPYKLCIYSIYNRAGLYIPYRHIPNLDPSIGLKRSKNLFPVISPLFPTPPPISCLNHTETVAEPSESGILGHPAASSVIPQDGTISSSGVLYAVCPTNKPRSADGLVWYQCITLAAYLSIPPLCR